MGEWLYRLINKVLIEFSFEIFDSISPMESWEWDKKLRELISSDAPMEIIDESTLFIGSDLVWIESWGCPFGAKLTDNYRLIKESDFRAHKVFRSVSPLTRRKLRKRLEGLNID